MSKQGRGGGSPGKGNPGGERGGNRGSETARQQDDAPRGSSQAAGKDPNRGKGE
jgi:hypothetical protein